MGVFQKVRIFFNRDQLILKTRQISLILCFLSFKNFFRTWLPRVRRKRRQYADHSFGRRNKTASTEGY